MNTTRTLLFSAILLALPLAAGAVAPTLKITEPTKSPTTNGTLNASGTATPAKGSAAITGVFYSLNNSPWTQADGTTNWSADNLSLTAGNNVFAAYTIDGNLAASKTNTVTFIYVVDVPITLDIGAGGTVSSVANGQLLQIGKTYKAGAKAAKGFAFTGWTGSVTSSAAKLSFMMSSNFTLNAAFKDTARPACVVIFPSVKHSVSNSPINVTGRTSDNVGVTAVNYQLNNGGWNAALLADGTNWEADNLALTVGANTVQAFAADAAGNLSPTNSVKFTYVSNAPPPPPPLVPETLSGLVAEVTIGGQPTIEACFGLSTYSQSDTNDPNNYNVGNYTYTPISSNQAVFLTTAVLPPSVTGGQSGATFTFTTSSNATFDTGGSGPGLITFSPAPNLVISPASIFTVEADSALGGTNIITFNGGLFTNDDGMGDITWGNYTFGPFSPLGAEIVEFYQDPADVGNTTYVQLEFSAANTGAYFVDNFDPTFNYLGGDQGAFTVLGQTSQPAGIAPASVAGAQWTVTVSGSSKSSFTLDFGASSMSQSSANADNNFVGDYTYLKTGPNTAQFQNVQTAPPSGQGVGNIIYINYTSATSATFARTNVDSGQTNIATGKATIGKAPATAPASLSGRVLNGKFSSHTATVTLNADGTFTNSESNGTQNSGTYSYMPYSPASGLLILSNTAGTDLGTTGYGIMTFTSMTAGSIFTDSVDSLGNQSSSGTGSFTLK